MHIPLPPEEVLETFHAACDAAAVALGEVTDWGLSQQRDTQYVADLQCDAAALDVLHGAGFAVLSEESRLTGPADAPLVVMDPLDGSTNASRGVPWYATSLCLLDDEGPVAAMVANQASGVRYWATRGGGAFGDGERLQASGCGDLGDAIIGVNGRPPWQGGWAQYRALGAAALDLCLVAAGVLDGYGTFDPDGALFGWDYLGAWLICTEAGAVAADLGGRDLVVRDYDSRRALVVAATDGLLTSLRGLSGDR